MKDITRFVLKTLFYFVIFMVLIYFSVILVVVKVISSTMSFRKVNGSCYTI